MMPTLTSAGACTNKGHNYSELGKLHHVNADFLDYFPTKIKLPYQ